MRRLVSLVGALAAAAPAVVGGPPPAAGAQPSAAEVVAGAVAAIGGQEAWDAVDTLELRGTFSTFSSIAHPFTASWQRPDLYRFDHFEADVPVVVAHDGEQVWWEYPQIPFSGVPWATAPSVAYSRGFAADAEFGGFTFLDWQKKGHRLELRGRVDLDGVDAWEVGIHRPAGDVETWHFDVASGLPLRRLARAGYIGMERDHEIYFDDFREVGGGLRLPHYVESVLGNRIGYMTVAEAQVDKALDAGIFRLPLAPAMASMADLAGTWTVEIESRPMPTLPWIPSTAEATFTSRFEGRVVDEDIAFLDVGRPRRLRRSYAWDRFRDRLTVVHLDDLTAHPILLEGPADEDPWVLSNAGNDTAWSLAGRTVHNRLTLERPTSDELRLTWEASFDGGGAWVALLRAHYRRTTP